MNNNEKHWQEVIKLAEKYGFIIVNSNGVALLDKARYKPHKESLYLNNISTENLLSELKSRPGVTILAETHSELYLEDLANDYVEGPCTLLYINCVI